MILMKIIKTSEPFRRGANKSIYLCYRLNVCVSLPNSHTEALIPNMIMWRQGLQEVIRVILDHGGEALMIGLVALEEKEERSLCPHPSPAPHAPKKGHMRIYQEVRSLQSKESVLTRHQSY